MRMLITFLTLLSSAGAWAQGAWKLDEAKSEFVVKVWKTGAAAGLAHDHVIRAAKFKGTASVDEAGAPESLQVTITVDVASLIPDERDTRKRYGVPGEVPSEADQAKVRENMLGAEQLDSAKFPNITFVSSKLYREESGALQCVGTLTLHGVTKELFFPVTVTQGEGALEGEAKVRFKTSDFGVKPYSAALGLIKNKDEVELNLRLVMKR